MWSPDSCRQSAGSTTCAMGGRDVTDVSRDRCAKLHQNVSSSRSRLCGGVAQHWPTHFQQRRKARMLERERPYMPAVEVFIAYSHADEPMKQELVKHLSPLQRSGLIEEWH